MATIWKYRLEPADLQMISMPSGARVLHVDAVGSELYLWALVDDQDEAREPRYFSVVGTGHIVPRSATHVGSALMRGGSLVWHVFERSS